MADADNPKQVNDSKYGHNGDRYLTAIAGLLKGCGRNKNCIASRLKAGTSLRCSYINTVHETN